MSKTRGIMQVPNETYWEEYTNLQHVKHKIIKEYLNGWFPKLGFWSGKIIYIDTHAGKGKYSSGKDGSPIVALKTFLEHKSREKILERSEIVLFFIERNQQNAESLQSVLEPFKNSHPKINWFVLNV